MNTKIEAIRATATTTPTSPNVPRDGPVDSTVEAAVKLVLGAVTITALEELVVVEEVPDGGVTITALEKLVVVEEVPDVTKVVEAG